MSDNDLLNTFKDILKVKYAKHSTLPTSVELREQINIYRSIPEFQFIDEDTAEEIAKDFEKSQGISMNLGTVLTSDQHEPWLHSRKATINPYYWKRYALLLSEKMSNNVINTIDQETDRILGLLQDPQVTANWDRRGLVMGHVQSGKTGNYTGLIAKAADAGYKLIIIIAGVNNNLRNQTQKRIDRDFIGKDSSQLLSANLSKTFIGVGKLDKKRFPSTFTSSVKDFNKTTATSVGIPLQNMNEPAVLVIKKNSSVLRNLIEWLKVANTSMGADKISEPMLMIDDEADNASINVKYGNDEVSRINKQIRQLLECFDRSCYVGYTATPFANIFIDPDQHQDMIGQDLFPRDFILSLEPPDNYVGPDQVFLDPENKMVLKIDDNQDVLPIKHNKDHLLTSLPLSLKKAIRQFVIARAIRLSRGHTTAHCSMLVNASVYNNVQNIIRKMIFSEVSDIQSSVKIHAAMPIKNALTDNHIQLLYKTWQEDFSDSEKDWGKVQPFLNMSAAAIEVVEINSQSKDALDYDAHENSGLTVIAVGGYSLSRGLTLEGLMVSYYLRRSIMYDTLMQMGRWFGYRDGYQDLCRVWMPEEARDWYEHISETIILLREELREMAAAGSTPEHYGLRVRSHPDNLMITGRNKMGANYEVVLDIGLAEKLIETHLLIRDEVTLEYHRKIAKDLVKDVQINSSSFQKSKEARNLGYLLQNVKSEHIINFISKFKNHQDCLVTQTNPVIRYIEQRNDDELKQWDLLLVSLQKEGLGGTDDSLGMNINCQERTESKNIQDPKKDLKISNKQKVSGPGIEQAGLSDDQLQKSKLQASEKHKELKNIPDHLYRKNRTRPLFILHLIKVGGENTTNLPDKAIVAWGISFPSTKSPQKLTKFVVGKTWMNEQFRFDIQEGEDLASDE